MNKNIIIAILIVIIIAIGAAVVLGNQHQSVSKQTTQIDVLNKTGLQNGEQVQFQLKAANGTALSGQSINITFNNEKYTVTTDQNGKGYLTLQGEDSGTYNLTLDYAGNDKYEKCSVKTTITIEDGEADAPATETEDAATANSGTNDSSGSGTGNSQASGTGNSSSSYHGFNGADEGIQVDDNGIIHAPGTQYDGMSMEDYIAWQEDPESFIDDLENQNR